MPAKSVYKTRQREELLAFLAASRGAHVTAADVCDHFRKTGSPIGTATVYRHLERMVDEGLVNKYVIDGSSAACFSYVGGDCGPADEACFHCKCEQCGRLLHLHCEELEELGAHLRSHHRFALNPRRTVFYGLCEACSAGEEARHGADRL